MSADTKPARSTPVRIGVFLFLMCCTRWASAESVLRQDTQRIRGFDPVRAGDVASALAIARIYEPLLQYSYLDRPYRVEPLLSDGMPVFSADGLTCTFKIRRGIFYQDDPCFPGGQGREVEARDFEYAIKRLADQKTQSVGYWILSGRIEGLDAFRERSGGEEPTDYDVPVSGIRVTDPHTLVLTLTMPYPQLLWVLTMPYVVATPREAVELYGDEFSRHPVGTGPYVLKEWMLNYRLEYVCTPKWQQTGRREFYPTAGSQEDLEAGLLADAGQPVPFIDRITDYVVMDPATRWMMFMTGQLDSSDVSRDNWDAILDERLNLNPELKRRQIQLTTGPSLRLGYFAFNMEDPVLGTNKLLRQAMTCAFDTEAWIKLYNSRITRPTGPIPEGLAGVEPDHNPYPFDLERARNLLAGAGYPDGQDPATGRRLNITLELGRADDAELRQSAELFAHFMSRIGIDINLSYNNGPAFYDKLERREAPFFFLSWLADYPDAENFLQLFYGPNVSPGPNRCNYRSEAFDSLYDQAKVMADSPGRTELYRQMSRIVVEDCPWIFAFQHIDVGLRHPHFRNYKMHAFPYGMEKYYRTDRGSSP